MCRFINGHIVPYAFQTQSQGRSPEYLGAYEDRRGNLWAYGDTYLINLAEGKRFNYFRSSESASVRIWSLCEGNDGRLWIGTSGRGLFCFEDNSFQPVMFDKNRWPYDVRAICEDDEGNLWLGTSGGGLMQLRPQSVYILLRDRDCPTVCPRPCPGPGWTNICRLATRRIVRRRIRDGLTRWKTATIWPCKILSRRFAWRLTALSGRERGRRAIWFAKWKRGSIHHRRRPGRQQYHGSFRRQRQWCLVRHRKWRCISFPRKSKGWFICCEGRFAAGRR